MTEMNSLLSMEAHDSEEPIAPSHSSGGRFRVIAGAVACMGLVFCLGFGVGSYHAAASGVELPEVQDTVELERLGPELGKECADQMKAFADEMEDKLTALVSKQLMECSACENLLGIGTHCDDDKAKRCDEITEKYKKALSEKDAVLGWLGRQGSSSTDCTPAGPTWMSCKLTADMGDTEENGLYCLPKVCSTDIFKKSLEKTHMKKGESISMDCGVKENNFWLHGPQN